MNRPILPSSANGKRLAFLKWAGKQTTLLADLRADGTSSYPIDPVMKEFTNNLWTRTLQNLS